MNEQLVKEKLAVVLSTVDLANSTERSIRATLEQELGDLSAFRILIRDEIENFLVNYDFEDEEPAKPAAAAPLKRPAEDPRAAARAAQPNVDPAKRQKLATPGDLPVELSSTRRVAVDQFKGATMVSIREYYSDAATGESKPTRKGITLNVDQWNKLKSGIGSINAALDHGGSGDVITELSAKRKVTVTPYKGTLLINLREYYEKDGEWVSGKGISLNPDQWQILCDNVETISNAIKAPASASASAPSSAPSSAPAPTPSGNTPAPPAPSGAGGSAQRIELSKDRFATVELFQGKPMVSVREFYEKDGEMRPGKKGLTMTKDQFKVLVGARAEVDKAVAENTDNYRIADLSSSRFVGVQQFKGNPLVSLREYYQKNGQMLPGKKGISLNPTQWSILSSNLAALDAHLDSL